MEKKLKEKWVKALESGKFRRAKGQLKADRGYCCLGVLCKITGTDFDPADQYLPKDLADQADISHTEQRFLALANDGDLLDEDDVALFQRYRDELGAPFKSIAKYIREHL